MLPKIIPECINPFIAVDATKRIGPALAQQTLETFAASRLQQRILQLGARIIDVVIGRNDVEITCQDDWMLAL